MPPLYIKHRPKKFKEVIGNEPTIKSLKSELNNMETFPHAVLFIGKSGCGKTTFARILASKVGCSKGEIKEYNAANTRGIDTIREIDSNSRFLPLSGTSKVYIIDEVGKLTIDAQNALLKPLEDTPSHVYYFLCTTEPEKIITTIRNRCTTYQVEPLDREEILYLLIDVSKKEKIKISNKVLTSIAKKSEGSARQALVELGKVAGMEEEKSAIEAIEGDFINEAEIIDLCRILIEKRYQGKWKQVTKILKGMKGEPEQIRYSILGYFTAVLMEKESDRVAEMITLFSENFYYSKKAGLVQACYLCTKM